MILNKRQEEAKKKQEDKIMNLVLQKNLTYVEAKKMVESNQSSLTDFRIR